MDITVILTLEDDLAGHVARYQELMDFLEVEKRHLLNLDLDGLLIVSKSKEKLADGIVNGGEKLKGSLGAAALMLGLPMDPPPTLAMVAAACPQPFGSRLADGASKLARMKNLIFRENSMAKHFVEKSLELVTDSINILSGANQLKGDSYSNDGKKEKGVKKALPSKISREV